LVLYLTMSVAIYVILRKFYSAYVMFWFLPFFLWNLLVVIPKEEIVHMRAHWTTNMTGSGFVDKLIDWTMIFVCGASKESFRRRHIAAHYADIGNMSRIFSDVWLPFITLPPVFYLRPHLLLKMVMDAEFLRKEKMSRSQLVIELVGLWSYLTCLIGEIVLYKSYWLLCFHMCPLIYYHASQILSATISHSGLDKRNSFNSNGLFDPDTVEPARGLFSLSLRILTAISCGGMINHGIHHAFTQLPLPIINQEYKIINKYALDTYKNVRYNNVVSMICHKNILDRLPLPRWYDFVAQFFVTLFVNLLSCFTILGLPVPPVVFELMVVDYRCYLYSTKAERYANILAFWDAVELMERKADVVNPNAYFVMIVQNYEMMKKYIRENAPDLKGPNPKEMYKALGSEEMLRLNIKQRGKF